MDEQEQDRPKTGSSSALVADVKTKGKVAPKEGATSVPTEADEECREEEQQLEREKLMTAAADQEQIVRLQDTNGAGRLVKEHACWDDKQELMKQNLQDATDIIVRQNTDLRREQKQVAKLEAALKESNRRLEEETK